ncbi:hypothetical protein K2173_007252 [Erythroxylum novogranatense]|uniref:CCHC-type domain-containing protein n=1 Tax=Erythroxylum novogranatense TaxID=1862640 RepID=A0AAV8UBZ4_9ROSI|nr:hypothetical protein K2173_007252 [Erythroxylum novogranatense]
MVDDMEAGIAALGISNREKTPLIVEGLDEDSTIVDEICLVGEFKTTGSINFIAMRAKLAEIWHPGKGVTIEEIGDQRFMIRFYHEVDVQRVIAEGPYNFNNHLLVLHRVGENEDPLQLGNTLGKFIAYDTKAITMGFRSYMRIRVRLDVREPLLRRKKVLTRQRKEVYVQFKYEKLPLFCYLCGRVGHGESFCPIRFAQGTQELELEWGPDLKATPQRPPARNRWLRDRGDPIPTSLGAKWKFSEKLEAISKSTIAGVKIGENSGTQYSKNKGITVEQRRQFDMDEVMMAQETEDIPLDFTDEQRPDIIFIIETILNIARMVGVRRSCGYYSGIEVPAKDTRGGLSMGWKEGVNITLKSSGDHYIDVEIVSEEAGNPWRFTGFYGNHEERLRSDSWDLLRTLKTQSNSLWIVMGDFNEITYGFEKQGRRIRPMRQMTEFRNALDECGLIDLGSRGPWFTWETGNTPRTNIRERLDRGVAISSWREIFPDCEINHLPHSISDHCPLLLDTHPGVTRERTEFPFRFESSWCMEDDCEEEIRKIWTNCDIDVPGKLNAVSEGLTHWSKNITAARFKQTKELKRTYPSLTWKSVWSAKALLATGLQWKVGNGQKISIWNDGWLPMPGNNHITKTDASISASFVADLFIPNERKWNIEKISNLFDPEEATRILSIPLAADEHEDELVWRYENYGIYTVKSGHKLLQRGIRTIHHTVSDGTKGLYSKLWNLQLPLKIKITIWQFIRNFVPTSLNLYNKHSANSSIC